MNILFAASEALPLIATGGLADVAGSLPAAINERGADCRIVLPLYSEIPEGIRSGLKFVTDFIVPVSWRQQYCGLFETKINNTVCYLLDNEYYFKRQGIYGHYDDAERFAFFSRAVLEMLKFIDYTPDIIHSNDWHTAMLPVFFNEYFRGSESCSVKRIVFTIHNIEYQGKYGMEIFDDILGLPGPCRSLLEFDGCINMMKGAIESADAVTTVSPTYAHELRYRYFAHGLQDIVRNNSGKFSGILNGLDNAGYDPSTDKSIFMQYTSDSPEGKSKNKAELQRMLGLEVDESAMLVGMVGRLVRQKGIDLVKYALEEMLSGHIQLVLLGKGDPECEGYFSNMQARYPGKLSVSICFDRSLARRIYAGSDVFLMPSEMEPCGLAQMISLRYGTIPVVRETGGLKDSIRDCGSPGGNGFTFKSFNAHDMLGAIERANEAFLQKELWRELVINAMKCDFGWEKSADEYISLYRRLLGRDLPGELAEDSPKELSKESIEDLPKDLPEELPDDPPDKEVTD